MTYLVDANVLIEAKNRYYAFDIAPGFWKWLNQAHAQGTVFSIEKVGEELGGGNDLVAYWAKKHRYFFHPNDMKTKHSSPGCPPGHKLRVSLRPHWMSSLLTQLTISSSPSPPPMRAPSLLMRPWGLAHASESRFLTPAKDLKSNGSTPLKCYVTPVSPLTFPALPTKSKRGTSNQPVTNASTRLEMHHSPTPTAHNSHTMTTQTSPAPTDARSIPAPPEPGQVVQVRVALHSR